MTFCVGLYMKKILKFVNLAKHASFDFRELSNAHQFRHSKHREIIWNLGKTSTLLIAALTVIMIILRLTYTLTVIYYRWYSSNSYYCLCMHEPRSENMLIWNSVQNLGWGRSINTKQHMRISTNLATYQLSTLWNNISAITWSLQHFLYRDNFPGLVLVSSVMINFLES